MVIICMLFYFNMLDRPLTYALQLLAGVQDQRRATFYDHGPGGVSRRFRVVSGPIGDHQPLQAGAEDATDRPRPSILGGFWMI